MIFFFIDNIGKNIIFYYNGLYICYVRKKGKFNDNQDSLLLSFLGFHFIHLVTLSETQVRAAKRAVPQRPSSNLAILDQSTQVHPHRSQKTLLIVCWAIYKNQSSIIGFVRGRFCMYFTFEIKNVNKVLFTIQLSM